MSRRRELVLQKTWSLVVIVSDSGLLSRSIGLLRHATASWILPLAVVTRVGDAWSTADWTYGATKEGTLMTKLHRHVDEPVCDEDNLKIPSFLSKLMNSDFTTL